MGIFTTPFESPVAAADRARSGEMGNGKCVISGLISNPGSAFSLWNARGLTLNINMGSECLLCYLVLVFSQNAGAESRE